MPAPQPNHPPNLRKTLGLSASIARRYAWSRRGAFSSVSIAAVVGLAISICVLIIALSVINGFERELKERVLGVTPHVHVFSRGGMSPHPIAPQRLASHPSVSGVAPFVQEAALITTPDHVAGVMVSGVDPDAQRAVSGVFEFIVAGSAESLIPRGYGVVLGARLARQLGASIDGRVTIVMPTATVSPVGLLPRQRQFTVVGIIDTQTEADGRVAYIHLADAQRLFRMGGKISGYQLRLHDLFDVEGAYDAVDTAFLEGGMLVRPWTRVHGNLLQAIITQKLTMFVLLSFLVGVAAFNLVSGLVMVVDQRASDVAVQRTLGNTTLGVVAVFVFVGLMLGGLGVSLGVAAGVALSAMLPSVYSSISGLWEVDLMTEYFIGYLPVEVRADDILAIIAVSLVLTLVATFFPAWRSARVRPAVVLAHE